jgi:hypothetical protein
LLICWWWVVVVVGLASPGWAEEVVVGQVGCYINLYLLIALLEIPLME